MRAPHAGSCQWVRLRPSAGASGVSPRKPRGDSQVTSSRPQRASPRSACCRGRAGPRPLGGPLCTRHQCLTTTGETPETNTTSQGNGDGKQKYTGRSATLTPSPPSEDSAAGAGGNRCRHAPRDAPAPPSRAGPRGAGGSSLAVPLCRQDRAFPADTGEGRGYSPLRTLERPARSRVKVRGTGDRQQTNPPGLRHSSSVCTSEAGSLQDSRGSWALLSITHIAEFLFKIFRDYIKLN